MKIKCNSSLNLGISTFSEEWLNLFIYLSHFVCIKMRFTSNYELYIHLLLFSSSINFVLVNFISCLILACQTFIIILLLVPLLVKIVYFCIVINSLLHLYVNYLHCSSFFSIHSFHTYLVKLNWKDKRNILSWNSCKYKTIFKENSVVNLWEFSNKGREIHWLPSHWNTENDVGWNVSDISISKSCYLYTEVANILKFPSYNIYIYKVKVLLI